MCLLFIYTLAENKVEWRTASPFPAALDLDSDGAFLSQDVVTREKQDTDRQDLLKLSQMKGVTGPQ